MLIQDNDDDWDIEDQTTPLPKVDALKANFQYQIQKILPSDSSASEELAIVEELKQKNQEKIKNMRKELDLQFQQEKNRVQESFSQKLKIFVNEAEEKLTESITKIKNAIQFDQLKITGIELHHSISKNENIFDKAISEATNRLNACLQSWSQEYRELEESLKCEFRTKHISEKNLKKNDDEEQSRLSQLFMKSSKFNLNFLMDRIKSEEQILLQAKQHLITTRNIELSGEREVGNLDNR